MCSAGVGISAAISSRNKATPGSAAGVCSSARTQVARVGGLTRDPSSWALGSSVAARRSQAASSWVSASPCAWAASLRSANWARSRASRWALKAASPRRAASCPPLGAGGAAPRSGARAPRGLSPAKRPPSLRSPNLPPRGAAAGSAFFMPGRSSPRTATTGLGAGLGSTAAALGSAGAGADSSVGSTGSTGGASVSGA